MNQKAINKLFIPFEQGEESTGREFGGTGLGLCIVKELLDLLGGKITVESKVGQGSEFRLVIPYDEVKSQDDVKKASNDRERSATFESTGFSILVAEDNDINQKVIKSFLQKLGYEPEFAANGHEALEAIEYKDFDIIFMDMRMPGMGGVEATEFIREGNLGGDPYIIALTANVYEEDKNACFNAGMNDFLGKPVKLIDIKKALSRAPEKKKAA
jgi:two-component system, sensor histidine kinase